MDRSFLGPRWCGSLVFASANARSVLGNLPFAAVTWPKGKETVASTGVIIVMVGIASMILFFFDAFWGTITPELMEFFGKVFV